MQAEHLFSVRGKKALVTGGAMGIGKSCATALAQGGADIVLVDFNQQVGEQTAEALSELGVEVYFLKCDVADEQQVQKTIATAVKQLGRLDIAINSAGILTGEPYGIHQSKQDWDKVLGVNLSGVWFCSQAQAQQMSQQTPMGGKIINIASLSARNPSENPAYSASKAGVAHLTRCLAMQLGANNINVNSISPGVLMSPMTARGSLAFRDNLRKITPMGYIGRPEEIHGPTLFLASAASDYVTGHDLLMDGGRVLGLRGLPERQTSPRISVEQELEQVRKDLDALSISYDDDVVVHVDE